MNLFDLIRTKTLLEGGNVSSQSPGWQGVPGDHKAEEIDLKLHNRDFMVGQIRALLKAQNEAFAATYGKPIWDPKLLDSNQMFSGSSLQFFDVKGVSTEDFLNKLKKTKVGDIDTQIDQNMGDEVTAWLKSIVGKQVGNGTFIGFNSSLSALWQLQDPPVKIQIDYELGPYQPAQGKEPARPTEWFAYSHSSDLADMEQGIKGVFHKYINRALTHAQASTKYVARVLKKSVKISPEPVTDSDYSFAVTSAQGGGLSSKYKPYIDPQTGQQMEIDGVPVMQLLDTKDRDYNQNLDQQFQMIFGRKRSESDKKLQNSFVGTMGLMNKNFSPEQNEAVARSFIDILFGRGAQMITMNDPIRDRDTKFAALDYMFENLKLPNAQGLRQEAVQMAMDYEAAHNAKKAPVAENFTSINEFAPSNSDDNNDDDALFKYVKMWYNGDLPVQQKIEKILDQSGWEIGEIESEEGGAFVVQSGDENGNTYTGWSAEELSNVDENFADGKHPEDKGDSKRYHVPTKASVSTLRNVAKHSSGRKAQLAHWMANMKAGKAKHESLSEAEVQAQLRKNMPHLNALKPADFLDLLDEIHDGNGNFKLENIPLNVKVDGFGGRFGKDAEGRPFMATSNTAPRYEAGFEKYNIEKAQKAGVEPDPERLAFSRKFDTLFNEMMSAIKMVDSALGPEFLVNKQVTCEVLFMPFAIPQEDGRLKFVGIHYDKLPEGVELALVPFRVVDASTGEDVPNAQEMVNKMTSLGQQGSVMFINNQLTQKEGLDVTALLPPLENIEEIKALLSGVNGKRDRASLEIRRQIEAQLQPLKEKLEQAIINDPNILGKDMLGKDYEGIVINSRLGPIKITSQEQRDVIKTKMAAKAAARAEQPRENQSKTAVVAVGSAIGHVGHQQLFNYAIKKAQEVGGDAYMFIGPAEGKDDPIPPAVKVQTWQKLYPGYANNISTVAHEGGTLLQKIKHELINPLPGKSPRYDNIIITVGTDRADLATNWSKALMKAVNKFAGYEHVKVMPNVTGRGENEGGTGMSGTALRNVLKDPNKTPEQQFAMWNQAYNSGNYGAQKLPAEWIQHLMGIARKGMGIQTMSKQPTQQVPQPVPERTFNALVRPSLMEGWKGAAAGGALSALAGPEAIPLGMEIGDKVGDMVSGDKEVKETPRQSNAAKLQKAWEREQEKSAAASKRGLEYMDKLKSAEPKKDEKKSVAEGNSSVSVRQWANQVRKDHGADVKFRNRQEGSGAVDSVIAKNSQGETVGVYNRKTGFPTVFEPKQNVAEGDVVAFPKKHKGDLAQVHSCPKCGGDLQGGKYMGHAVKVCMPCKQVYLPPNSGIDQKGNKIQEGLLDPTRRQQLIRFLAKKMDWEVSYLELASDAELISWYKKVQAGLDPMKESVKPRQLDSPDAELQTAMDFAKGHYSHYDDPKMAFNKWVQRSLSHAKATDASQDKQIAVLKAEIAKLKTQATAPAQPATNLAEKEGEPEGVPHLSKELLTHIVQQVGTEGAHAIVKSLTWGDGAAAELLRLITKDLKQDIANMKECAGVGTITKQNSTKDVNKNTPMKNLKAFNLAEKMMPASNFAGSKKNPINGKGMKRGNDPTPVKAGDLVGGAEESVQREDKKKGIDGKACWKGKRYAGTENGKDKCVPIGEHWEREMSPIIDKILSNYLK